MIFGIISRYQKLFFYTPQLLHFIFWLVYLSGRLRNVIFIFQLKDNELFADLFLYHSLFFLFHHELLFLNCFFPRFVFNARRLKQN